MSRKPYPSDVTDTEWTILEPLLPPEKPVGSDRKVDLREVLNALMYVADNGIKWRAMPHDFPAWQTVYGYLRRSLPEWAVGADDGVFRATSPSVCGTKRTTQRA